MSEKTTEHEFKAEVRQLLDILVHSLYTNKEIFLRELISNASDALDKIRFETNRGTEIIDDDLDLDIKVTFDKEKNVLWVKDTGIGMSREELIEDIGTIARSGSAQFLKEATDDKEKLEGIIGKFGVGFYSVFMVAKEVIIRTKSYKKDEPAVVWKSDGLGKYELSDPDEELKRGTTIEVHLREDANEYAEKWRIENIVKKHSNFVSFPIFVEEDRINTIAALWREPKFNIKEEQYNEFYKFLTYDTEEPFDKIHISIDAPVQYNALLFFPKSTLDLVHFQKERPGLDLYIRRVLIQKGNKDLIPEYLGFIRGVVDSEDLPLNISRETLQENRNLIKITSNITKQILSHIQKIAKDDPEKYQEFWNIHGNVFKLGYTDFANREKFAELLRFNSSKCDDKDQLVSLDEYIERAKPGQKEIYFATGQSRESFSVNPHMEIFKDKGIEVFYLFEPLDEFALEALRTHKEFEIKSIEHADMKALRSFDSEEKEEKAPELSDEDENSFDKLLVKIKDLLGDRVTEVKRSTRLKESPCCLVSPDGTMTSSMQRIMQIVGKDSTIPAKILEVNPDHPLLRNVLKVFQADENDPFIDLSIEQIFESALLVEGYLKDPHALVERIQKLLNQSSSWYLAVKQID